MVYIYNLKGPASFLIQLVFIEVWARDLKILKQMTYQCATVPPINLQV